MNLSVETRVDGLSIVFLLLVAFLIPMVVLISFTSIRKNICNYCWLVAGIEVMLIYTFLSFVIQLLFLSFEMMLLLMCFSVSTWGTKLYKIRSSFYLFVFTVFGGIFWVICTVTLSLITRTKSFIAVIILFDPSPLTIPLLNLHLYVHVNIWYQVIIRS